MEKKKKKPLRPCFTFVLLCREEYLNRRAHLSFLQVICLHVELQIPLTVYSELISKRKDRQ